MISPPDENIITNAVGGKTARACDFCIRKRARWYCAADDAFLCQPCDSSVHSANPLARRHQRVRLKTASFKRHRAPGGGSNYLVPSWHRGLTRRIRTPRHGKPQPTLDHSPTDNIGAKMPELIGEADEDEDMLWHEDDESEEQLLYQVPIMDPAVARFCMPAPASSANTTLEGGGKVTTDLVPMNIVARSSSSSSSQQQQQLDHIIDCNNSSGLLLTLCDDGAVQIDDLVEFTADVDTLLGRGLLSKSYGEDLKVGQLAEKDKMVGSSMRVVVKVEDHEYVVGGSRVLKAEAAEIDVGREPFELNLEYDEDESPTTCEGEDVKVAVDYEAEDREVKRRKVLLALDYEAVSAAWASRGSPWMNGGRPLINPDDSWSWPDHSLGGGGTDGSHGQAYTYVGGLMAGAGKAAGDGGREARVSRYREKRRTRLFSKKIRYEVRKLNAEKRPRMKGRFVKRSSFPIPAGTAASGPAATSFPVLAK